MLRKEFKEVLTHSLVFALICLLLPLMLKVTMNDASISYFDIFFLMYQYLLPAFALFLGNSLFLSDRKQRAEDYLFSLPYSRLQVLGAKVLPRFAAVTVFYLAILVLFQFGGKANSMFTPYSFAVLYGVVFVIALSLSASVENYSLMAVMTVILVTLFLVLLGGIPNVVTRWFAGIYGGVDIQYMMQHLSPQRGGVFYLAMAVVLLLLLPFAAAFVYAFKKIGLNPSVRFNKRYAKVFFPLLAVGVVLTGVIAYATIPNRPNFYYVTDQHRLLESNHLGTRIYDGETVNTLLDGGIIHYGRPPLEKDGGVYAVNYYDRHTHFFRMASDGSGLETLHKRLGWIGWGSTHFCLYKDSLIFFENSRTTETGVMVTTNIKTGAVMETPLAGKFPEKYYWPILCGADEFNGKHFRLISSMAYGKTPVMMLWDDGTIENLGMTTIKPVYLNRTLITGDGDQVLFRRMTENGMETVHQMPLKQGLIIDPFNRSYLDTAHIKETYGYFETWKQDRDKGKKRYGFFRLNLETFETQEMTAVNQRVRELTGKTEGFVHRPSPETWYFIETERRQSWRFDIRRVSRLSGETLGETLVTVKEFTPARAVLIQSDVTKNGIIIREKDAVRVYAFPDLRELTFKKLN